MYDKAVEGAGKTSVTAELGGGGTATARTVANVGERIECGLLRAEPPSGRDPVRESRDVRQSHENEQQAAG